MNEKCIDVAAMNDALAEQRRYESDPEYARLIDADRERRQAEVYSKMDEVIARYRANRQSQGGKS